MAALPAAIFAGMAVKSPLLLSTPWAIEKVALDAFMASLANGEVVLGATEYDHSEEFNAVAISPEGSIYRDASVAPEGSVAVVQLKGIMMRNTDPELNKKYGWRGSIEIASDIRVAASTPNIIGTVVIAGTPGGQVEGTEELAADVFHHAEQKPIVGHIEQASSAGMWALSGATKNIMASPLSSMGSIGIMSSVLDIKDKLEKEGIKVLEHYSSASTEKNAAWNEMLAGKPERYIKEVLDPINEQFMGTVKHNRRGRLNEKHPGVLNGANYLAEEAIKAGLADDMGSLQDAVDAVRQMAEENTNPNSTTMWNSKNKFEKVGALNGAEDLTAALAEANEELTTQGITGARLVNAEMADNIDAALKDNIELGEQLKANSEELGTAVEASHSALKAVLASLDANKIEHAEDINLPDAIALAATKLAEYGKGPATPAAPKKEKQEEHGDKDGSPKAYTLSNMPYAQNMGAGRGATVGSRATAEQEKKTMVSVS